VSETTIGRPEYYAIHISEQIPEQWSAWFEGLTITYLEDNGAILSGPVADQSALHGLINKVRDLNLSLISINQIENPLLKRGPEDQICL
jgi:hypothetical protein